MYALLLLVRSVVWGGFSHLTLRSVVKPVYSGRRKAGMCDVVFFGLASPPHVLRSFSG